MFSAVEIFVEKSIELSPHSLNMPALNEEMLNAQRNSLYVYVHFRLSPVSIDPVVINHFISKLNFPLGFATSTSKMNGVSIYKT